MWSNSNFVFVLHFSQLKLILMFLKKEKKHVSSNIAQIIIIGIFTNLRKFILIKFTKYFLIQIMALTIQLLRSSTKYVIGERDIFYSKISPGTIILLQSRFSTKPSESQQQQHSRTHILPILGVIWMRTWIIWFLCTQNWPYLEYLDCFPNLPKPWLSQKLSN